MSVSRMAAVVFSVWFCGACGGGAAAPTDGASAGDGGTGSDGPVGCPAGQQDQDGDGVCLPDCASMSCGAGTCAIDAGGRAACACPPGLMGATCAELAVPDASKTAFWVDAAEAGTVTTHPGATTVATWADRGPQRIAGVAAATSSAPTVVAGALGGRPVLHFDGKDDHLTFPGVTGLTGTEYTLFAVLRNAGASAGTVLQGAGPNDSVELNSSMDNLNYAHEPMLGATSLSASRESYGGAGWGPDTFHLVTFRVRSKDIATWIDGNHMEATPTYSAAKISETLKVTIGGRANGGNAFAGELAELILVPKALHHGERAPFEDYLAAKWFGAAFPRTPSAFGVTAVWLDASQASTITTANGALTAWENRGYQGGAFANGTFADARPTLVPAGLNGKPVVRFDGSDALVQNELTHREGGEAGQYTVIAVVAPPTKAGFTGHLLFRANRKQTSAPGLEMFLVPNMLPMGSVVFHHEWPSGGNALETVNAAADFTKPTIIKVERSAAASYHLVAGAATGTLAGQLATQIPAGEQFNWSLGGEAISAPGSALTGDVAEFIVLMSDLGQSEETALLSSLRAKWGL